MIYPNHCLVKLKSKNSTKVTDQVLTEGFDMFFIEKILKIRSSIKNSQSSDSQSEIANIKEYLCTNVDDTFETFKPTDVD